MESVLLLLKLLGISVAGLLGIIGTRHDFKNSAGRLTKWGKRTVFGIAASTAVAVTAQFLEHHVVSESSREASHQAARTAVHLQTVVAELSRDLQTFDTISMGLRVYVPMADKSLAKYKVRLDRGVAERIARQRQMGFPYEEAEGEDGLVIGIMDKFEEKSVILIGFGAKNPMYPTKHDDPCAIPALVVERADLLFFKAPGTWQDLQRKVELHEGTDLKVELTTDQPMSMRTYPDRGTYGIAGVLVGSKNSWENRTGRIVSVPDLNGAQFFLHLGWGGDLRCPEFHQLQAQFEIDDIQLRFGNRELRIKGKELTKRAVGIDNMIYWEFRFGDPALPPGSAN